MIDFPRHRRPMNMVIPRNQMRISFDLDDTLILHGREPLQDRGILVGWIREWSGERLRAGTRELFRELRRRGFRIWIYTSSGRTPFGIRRWLLFCGLRIDGVVNEERHRRVLAAHRFPRMPSKYPPAFGIDWHVDDSEGVGMEGKEHGFRVIVVRPDDEDWTRKVLEVVSDACARGES